MFLWHIATLPVASIFMKRSILLITAPVLFSGGIVALVLSLASEGVGWKGVNQSELLAYVTNGYS